MEILNLVTNEVNQNEYHFNKLTRNKIGILYVAPVNIVPEDCLACDGYVLKIVDYKKLHSVIGNYFNSGGEEADEFRIPDYNISQRLLQPGKNIGDKYEAGLPNITGWLTDINSGGVACGGAFYYASNCTHKANGTNAVSGGWGFSANLSNPIYGRSTTVQPPSQIVHICIKYK